MWRARGQEGRAWSKTAPVKSTLLQSASRPPIEPLMLASAKSACVVCGELVKGKGHQPGRKAV